MKILSIGNFGTGWDGSICDEVHIADALVLMGHTVFEGQREHWVKIVENEYSEDLLFEEIVKSNTESFKNLDFILVSQWDGYPEGFIPYLKHRKNIPVVYWAFDYQADGQAWHEGLVAGADLYLSKRIADSKYPNWQWLSQDFAPEFLHRHSPYVDHNIDVLFTGSYLPWATERNEILKVVDEKYNLTIHSVNKWPGFKNIQPPIMDEGLPALYARAKVILSIDHTIETGYWSDRNAQIMACDARPLFRYVPMSEHTFHNYVDYFYSLDDCMKQIDTRLHDYDENMENIMSLSTYDYAQSHLMVKNRVQDLLTIVGSIL